MLGKLMKYEWKATWKLLLPANLLIVVMTLLAWFSVNMEFSSDYDMKDFLFLIVLLTYVISMFAVYVGTAIYLIHRFYTSTYGDQGYLLHTLPVDTHHIIIAKMLVSALWVLLSSMLMYFSILFLFTASEDIFVAMMEGVVDTIEYMGAEKGTIFAALMTIIAYLFSVFSNVLKVGACISLGQLSRDHKLLLSFGWYVGIYLVERFFQGIYWGIRFAFQRRLDEIDPYFFYAGSSWETTLLAGIVCSVVFYVLIWYVMDKKLNLD